jgi:zinc transport system ATP-binding protein
MKKPVIELSNVSFYYGNQPVLKNVTFQVESNDFMAILGPNGGGKTTLLKLILGLLMPIKGEIKILGEKPRTASRKIGYVPQYGEFDKHFPITVKDVILMSKLHRKSFFPFYSGKDEEKADSRMKELGIEELAKKKFGSLSGGQKQRVLIARALLTEPEILLLDEPMSSLDSHVEKDIYELLSELKKRLTILFVSHDIHVISRYVNKVTCLNIQSTTHSIDELDKKKLVDVYSGALQTIKHSCNL